MRVTGAKLVQEPDAAQRSDGAQQAEIQRGVLELLHRAGERRLSDVALLGGARKVERCADRKKTADLVHLHDDDSHFTGGRCPGGIDLMRIGYFPYGATGVPMRTSLPTEFQAGPRAGRFFRRRQAAHEDAAVAEA
jgi:hypothetical protein